MRLFLASLFLTLLATPSLAQPQPTVAEPQVLRLEPYRKGVAARVRLDGVERLLVFDTAGGISVLAPEIARAAGCEPWGALVGHRMTGDRLTLPRCERVAIEWDGVRLEAPVAGVLDATSLMAVDAAPIDGLLALDVFDGQTITIDFAALSLIIETPESLAERVSGAIELPARLAREVGGRALAVYIDVPSARGSLAMELDSGNGGTILVSKPYAAALGLDPAAPGPQRGAFPIAEGVEARGVMFTPELVIDGNLGMPFLRDWAVTLDLARGRVWLKPSAATPPPSMGAPPPLE
ncbi:hypothetical protein [Sphingosinithalassobacter sp. CS137]|uniref:hypothetical protein n=1 Tax=Sphingosinithalassobacter sp. CS137 TaxID=2762748 RepID=UPI00165E2745|nr:hypothetical protein [Sphingosinithalassobacter sp. CS137]